MTHCGENPLPPSIPQRRAQSAAERAAEAERNRLAAAYLVWAGAWDLAWYLGIDAGVVGA